MGGPVTDVHVHIQPREMIKPAVLEAFRKGCKDAAAAEACFDSSKALLDYMDRAGVARMVLINYEAPDVMGFTRETNDWVLRYCKAAPDRLLPCVGLNPRFTQDLAGESRRLIDAGARLFKVHGPHMLVAPNDYLGAHPALADLYRAAARAKVPVMFHTGTSIFRGARVKFGDPLSLDDVGNDFPDLTVLLAHGGRPLWTEEAWFLLRRFPRFHLDLSGIPPARLLEWFPRLVEIAERCCFGTDWPSPGIPPVKDNLDAVRALPLPPAALESILSTTALRFLNNRGQALFFHVHALQPVFERFGRVECGGTSPLYERLSEVVAASPELLAIAETALPGQRPPNMLFGAVHLLLARHPRVPLASWYPDFAGGDVRPDDPGPAFRAFCLEHRREIVALLGEKRVQTNEVQRCLLLLPAFQLVETRTRAPLAIVEIGTSAGLLLQYDRYAYEYRGSDRRVLAPPRATVHLTTEAEGNLTPPVRPTFPEVGFRVGLDVHPLDASSPRDREWLLALVWPEHAERRKRLAAALDMAAADPPPVRRGDGTTDLAAVLEEAPRDAALVVFHMSVLHQVPAAGKKAIDDALLAASRAREVWRVANDLQPEQGERLPITLSHYRAGHREDRLLAEAPGHVRWLRWVDAGSR